MNQQVIVYTMPIDHGNERPYSVLEEDSEFVVNKYIMLSHFSLRFDISVTDCFT